MLISSPWRRRKQISIVFSRKRRGHWTCIWSPIFIRLKNGSACACNRVSRLWFVQNIQAFRRLDQARFRNGLWLSDYMHWHQWERYYSFWQINGKWSHILSLFNKNSFRSSSHVSIHFNKRCSKISTRMGGLSFDNSLWKVQEHRHD